MLDRLISALPIGNRKFPLKYRRMLGILRDRMEFAKSRYLFAKPTKTPGIDLLRLLILGVDMEELDSCRSDVQRYTEIIKNYKLTKLHAFDPVANGTVRGGKFMIARGDVPPSEVFLNVDPSNPLLDLPFDKPWDVWQELRGIRLLYHNSMELIDNAPRTIFEFKRDAPSFIVYSLDVSILVFKYYKYWKNCQTAKIEPDIDEYLKRYELAKFFDDQYNLWILNLMLLVLANPNKSATDIVGELSVPARLLMSNTLLQGVEGLVDFMNLIKSGAVKPQDFLVTRWFPDTTILEHMAVLNKWCDLPTRHQYLWARALLWYPYLTVLILLATYFPEGGINRMIMERADETYVKYFKYVKMPNVNGGIGFTSFCEKLNAAVVNTLNGKPVGELTVADRNFGELTNEPHLGELEEGQSPST